MSRFSMLLFAGVQLFFLPKAIGGTESAVITANLTTTSNVSPPATTLVFRSPEAELFDYLTKRCSLADPFSPTDGVSPLNVQVLFDLYRFYQLLDRYESLAVLVDFRIIWNNPCAKWSDGNETAKWVSVSQISAPSSLMWRPILQQMNAAEDVFALNRMSQDTTTYIEPDGTFTFQPMGKLETICELDLRRFPFDSQRCEIWIESWEGTSRIIFTAADFVRYEKGKVQNGDNLWHLADVDSQLLNMSYNSDPEIYSRAVFRIHFDRNNFYFVYTIILPCASLAFVQLSTFLMNPEFSDRPYFSVSCVLSLAVLIAYMSSLMPMTSQVVLLSINMACQFVIGILVTVYAMITCMLSSHKSFNRVKQFSCIRLTVVRWLDVIFGVITTIALLLLNTIIYSLIVPNKA